MNYTNNQHKLTSHAYEGYGVYEFNAPGHWYTPPRGRGQLSGLADLLPGGMPSVSQAMTTQAGLQVVKSEFRETALGLLNQMVIKFDQSDINAVTLTGQASMVFGSVGAGFASDYLGKGYAIMAEITTVEGGTPMMLLTKDAATIAKSAAVGAPYVIVAGPGALLGAASAMVSPATLPPNGGPVLPPPPNGGGATLPPTNGQTLPASTETPTWVIPVVVGVGALALVAVVMSAKKK